MSHINTDKLSATYRNRAIDLPAKKILMTRLAGSDQEADLTLPPNCRGFGRIRHFCRATTTGFPANSLPIDPAAHVLNLPMDLETLEAQVFQSAVCNWRCWYCFVPFNLLSADPNQSAWLTVDELLDFYQEQENPPRIIDLSGGQPDLTPEWVPWMMEALLRRGLEKSVYLWSDDNLSNDYFWRHLENAQITLVREYANYGRVCCFKGFDSESFAFNTQADAALFDQQFDLIRRFLDLGIDLYAYATFPTPSNDNITQKMRVFVDRLQRLHHYLPLRTVPLEIQAFGAVQPRIQIPHTQAMANQFAAVEAWNLELEKRFSSTERSLNITDVPLRRT
jgi:uncharacterized Fe-S cluster-containing radical SAM superfamily protein